MNSPYKQVRYLMMIAKLSSILSISLRVDIFKMKKFLIRSSISSRMEMFMKNLPQFKVALKETQILSQTHLLYRTKEMITEKIKWWKVFLRT